MEDTLLKRNVPGKWANFDDDNGNDRPTETNYPNSNSLVDNFVPQTASATMPAHHHGHNTGVKGMLYAILQPEAMSLILLLDRSIARSQKP